MKQAVILCGGYGKRLGATTKKIPKPLIKVNGSPFLENIIFQYSRFGVKKILLLCSYKHKLFFNLYHKKKLFNCNITCINEGEPLGTAGALRKAIKSLDKNFFVSNGDTLVNFNPLLLIKASNKKTLITLAGIKSKNKGNRYGGLKFDRNNNIQIINKNSEYINSGYYYINKRLIYKIKKKNFSFEKDVLTNLKKNLIKGIILNKPHNYFLDIGTPKDLASSKKFLKKFYSKPAVFLDRDGVINKDKGYVFKYKDISYINNISNCIQLLNNNNFYVFVVSNQSGIGRGYYTSQDVDKLHKKINLDLLNNYAHIDEFVYAPYYKFSKKNFFYKDKKMRKPNTGMIDYLKKNWSINKNKSLIIGDKESDKNLAINSNFKYLILNRQTDLVKILKKKLNIR